MKDPVFIIMSNGNAADVMNAINIEVTPAGDKFSNAALTLTYPGGQSSVFRFPSFEDACVERDRLYRTIEQAGIKVLQLVDEGASMVIDHEAQRCPPRF